MLIRIELLNAAETEARKARVVADITAALNREPIECLECDEKVTTCPACREPLADDNYPFQVKVELDDGTPRCGI